MLLTVFPYDSLITPLLHRDNHIEYDHCVLEKQVLGYLWTFLSVSLLHLLQKLFSLS